MEESRLQHFPISFFAVVMGLTGLGIAYMRIAFLGDSLKTVGIYLSYLSTLIFFLLLFVYFLKLIRYPEAVKAEYNHPVRISFFPAISISFLLLSIAYGTFNQSVSYVMWIIGTILHFFFFVRTLLFWFNKEIKIEMLNPSWFIPVVGTILIPISGINYSVELSWFFFSTGIIFWICIFTLILFRLFFYGPLPDRLYPTLVILIAPPAVGFISYIKMIDSIDTLGNLLFYSAIALFVLIVALINRFLKLKFFLSWWAYTFPLDALTISIILRFHKTGSIFYKYLSGILLTFTTIVIAIVTLRTIYAIIKREICVEE